MERPRLFRIMAGVVFAYAAVVVVVGVIPLFTAKSVADNHNKDLATTTTTSTTAPVTDEYLRRDYITPGDVRLFGAVVLGSGVLVGGLMWLANRRDRRARIPLMVALGASALLAILGIFSIAIALFGIYVLQFDLGTKQWFAGATAAGPIETTAREPGQEGDEDEDDGDDEPPDDARPGYRWPRRPR